MPIISKIGRRSLRSRALIGAMYALLAAGAISMIYPFLLLVSGSTKSGVDTPQAVVVPPFLGSSLELYRKSVEAFFNEKASLYGAIFNIDKPSFEVACPLAKPNPKLAAEWGDFLVHANFPHWHYTVANSSVQQSKMVAPSNLREFKSRLSHEYGGDIVKLNAGMGISLADWSQFRVIENDMVFRTFKCGDSKWDQTYFKFKEGVPVSERIYFSVPGDYVQTFLKSQYANDLASYNKANGTDFKSWSEIRLERIAPPASKKQARTEWELFVREILSPLWIRIDSSSNDQYRAFLKEKYDGRLAELNKKHGAQYASFEDVHVNGQPPVKGVASSDWIAFLNGWKDPETETGKSFKAPLESLSIYCTDFLFQDWLKAKYGDIQKVDASLGGSFKSWQDILAPQADAYAVSFEKSKAALRWEFCVRNFLSVFDYLLLHGSALLNTVIYCSLTIVCALVVNPIAAYALSRFKLPSTYKVLLFLMLTMAFPPVVTQIPNFLMLRDLNMLNSYAALILPGLANGYSIFLLKGFFDSLPQELYESASLDGAGEVRIFFQITMSLSKPILAVIALGAFTAAYGNFMMALLVCQDRSMWTIMPFLFELQQNGCQGLVFASLLVAAIPTLIIFTLCQNVIMRGIVVPVEK